MIVNKIPERAASARTGRYLQFTRIRFTGFEGCNRQSLHVRKILLRPNLGYQCICVQQDWSGKHKFARDSLQAPKNGEKAAVSD